MVSIFLTSFFRYGNHTVAAYSNLGHIIVTFNFLITSSSRYEKVSLIYISQQAVHTPVYMLLQRQLFHKCHTKAFFFRPFTYVYIPHCIVTC